MKTLGKDIEKFGKASLVTAFAVCIALIPQLAKALEINEGYLNNLTSPSVSWEAVEAAGDDTVNVNGIDYRYSYIMPEGYTKASSSLKANQGTLNETAATNKVFENFVANDGGAIDNNVNSRINIKSDFINNYTSVSGGAIYNGWGGTINNLTGIFLHNYTNGSGGAINLYQGGIFNLNGNFVGNYSNADGGAIYIGFSSSIGSLNANFIGNYSSTGYGGAINNYQSTIGNINGDFVSNNAKVEGGAIFSGHGANIGEVRGNFINNFVDSGNGGAIYNGFNSTFGKISGSFINNQALAGSGGAINNYNSTIAGISGSFEGNKALNGGGAIYNGYGATIGDISADFTNNSASMGNGGAIDNYKSDLYLTNSNFYNNYAVGENALGGAILNTVGDINITADNGSSIFRGNYVQDLFSGKSSSNAIFTQKGALNLNAVNNGLIQFDDKIASKSRVDFFFDDLKNEGWNFVSNGDGSFVVSKGGVSYALTPDGNGWKLLMGEEEADDNFIQSAIETALENPETFKIETISENNVTFRINEEFVFGDSELANYPCIYSATKIGENAWSVDLSLTASNYGDDITITGDQSSKIVFNETVDNFNKIDISGTNVEVNNGPFYRSTVHDDGRLNINKGVSAVNTTVNNKGTLVVQSGAVANNTTVNSGGTLNAKTNSNLNNLLANGGAILDLESGAVLQGSISINKTAELKGDYDYSNIFKNNPSGEKTLTLTGGINEKFDKTAFVIDLDDKSLKFSGGEYNVGSNSYEISGWDEWVIKDNTLVKLNGDIEMAQPNKNIMLLNGSELNLAGNSPGIYQITGSVSNDGLMNFSHDGDFADDVTTIYGNYKAYKNAQIQIDVDPVNNVADKLVIEGDVEGTTGVIINPLSDGETSEKVLFITAMNDLTDTAAHFEIARVIGDAKIWNVLYENNQWYVGTQNIIADSLNNGYGNEVDLGFLTDSDSLAPDVILPPNFKMPTKSAKIEVAAEAMAYAGLVNASVEQSRSLIRNIAANIESTKLYDDVCGYYDCKYDGKPLNTAWATPVLEKAEITSPVDMEAEIKGFEGGFDIQRDAYNRLGIFASYRNGEYELSGDGEDIFSKIGSDIEINSYVLGLYHRYDKGRYYGLGALWGGYNDIDITTNDGVSSKTDGWTFGASYEAGMAFEPRKDVLIQPLARLSYLQTRLDDATDKYRKTAEYDTISDIEIEAGVKIAKKFDLSEYRHVEIYIKPSIIQNFGKGDVAISGLNDIEGINDKTLGRAEIGASFDFDDKWSGYADLGHTFGDDYKSTDSTLGVSYSW